MYTILDVLARDLEPTLLCILDVLAGDLEPTLLRIFFVIFGGKDNILSQFCIVKDWERILALQVCHLSKPIRLVCFA